MFKKKFMIRVIFLASFVLSISFGLVQAQEESVRLAWWGNEPRHDLYGQLSDMFEDATDITLEREFNSWGGYWELLATQVAGGNLPDILHMHPNFVAEYASRGALLDLTPYVESGQLDLSAFPEGILNSGKVDDAVYMVTLGNSSPGIHYNTVYFEEAGIEIDPYEWTWEDFMEITRELADVVPEDGWVITDEGSSDQGLEVFMRQRGKDFFIDGELGFDREDLIAYWGMWEELRQEGLIPPADVMQEYENAGHADSMLANGLVAMDLLSGNQHKLFQAQTEDELGLAVIPRTMGEDGELQHGDVIGGAYLSCAAETEHVDACIEYINWMVNDSEVALIYNGEHGPPGNAELAALVAEDLEPADQRLFEMMAAIAPYASLRGQRPEWGTEAADAFSRIYLELSFGNVDLEQAVDLFFEEVDFISS